MKKYDKPEEYIRRLESSNEDLRKELKKYKYNEAINYELEEENKILKEKNSNALVKEEKKNNWLRLFKLLFIACGISGVVYSIHNNIMFTYILSIIVIFKASDLEC